MLPFSICGYGFLPVSFDFNKGDISQPNNLLIQHQECSCPCPDAYAKDGQLTIPDSIIKKYSNISRREINLEGRNPYVPYDFELAHQEIIVTGKVVGVDTILCEPTNCEVVPVFKVDKWATQSYFPRFWTHGNIFILLFLLSSLLSIIVVLIFCWITIKRVLINNLKGREK